MTPKQLENTYEKLKDNITRATEKFNLFRESIKQSCHHPKKYEHKVSIDNDDGYGTWWKTHYLRCEICGNEEQVFS